MTRHGPHCTITAISTPQSPGSFVPGPRDIASVTQCSATMGCIGQSFVFKSPDYTSSCSLSSAERSTTKTIRNPLSP